MQSVMLPVFLLAACVIGPAVVLLVAANLFNTHWPGRVRRMPYYSPAVASAGMKQEATTLYPKGCNLWLSVPE